MEEKDNLFDSWIQESVKADKPRELKSHFTANVMTKVMNHQKTMSQRKLWFLVPFSIAAISSFIYLLAFTPFGNMVLSFLSEINLFGIAEGLMSLPILIGLFVYLIGARFIIGIFLVKRIGFRWKSI